MKSKSRHVANIFKASLAVCLSLGLAVEGLACSALSGSQGPVLGGNYDWYARGGIAFISPRGQMKSSEATVEKFLAVRWVSRFGSLTISQFGRDFPMQGMNEAGLSGMVLVGDAVYPEPRAGETLTENLWLQYQLDKYETIDDVIRHVDDLGIKKLSAAIHWFMCDRSNACAVIEFINGRAVVYSGAALPVAALTNTGYASSNLGYQKWRDSQEATPGGYDSLARFIRLAESGGKDIPAQLDDVARRGFTAIQTVFEMERRSLSTRIEDGPWVGISLSDLSFECVSMPLMLDLRLGKWTSYNHDAVVELFTRGTRGTTGLGPEVRDRILSASKRISCYNK